MFIRWVRFTAAGSTGFVVQLAVLAALLKAGFHYQIAAAIGVELAILTNFAWHEYWTWRDRPSNGAGERLTRLAGFNLLTGVVSIGGTAALMAVLVGIAGMPPLPANVLSVFLLGLFNFVGADTFVFRARPLHSEKEPPCRRISGNTQAFWRRQKNAC